MEDIRVYFDVLIRRWQIIIAMPILAVIAAALATLAIKPTFEATATIALAPTTVSVSLSNLLPPYYLTVSDPRNLPIAFTPTYYIAILNGADVVSAAQPRAAITVSGDGNDRALLHISARGGDANLVAEAANSYAQAGTSRITQLLQPTGGEAEAAKQKLQAAEQAIVKYASDNGIDYDPSGMRETPQLPRGKELQFQALQRDRDIAEAVYLDFARELERTTILANNAYRPILIPAIVPTAPVSPKFAQNILFGAAFGLLIGIIGAFGIELVAHFRKV
jgi:uncharacterized protein involved in exopolysaccharide biosynthesis